jgi:hypothetical protein
LVLEELYAGDEARSLDPVLVQVVWVAVGSYDHNHSMVHQILQQSAQNHCISYICDLELVKTQDTGLLREILGHFGYRIAPATTHGYFGGMYPFMDIDHECVEMNSAFTRYRRGKGVIEQVHEHGLPGPNVPIEV